MSATFTDIFCGAGGSSIGLAAAGLELKLAANHWPTAIATHSANFRDAEHLCADVNNYDMRRLPRTTVLWASPICTEASPAAGNAGGRRPKGVGAGQLDLLEAFGHVPKAGMERTRATFHDVIRATEVHRYEVVLVENVPDVVDRWELFDWWLQGMRLLGYDAQLVSISSAHVGDEDNPRAPQWRDRLYIVFTRTGMPLPDVTPRPVARCEACGDEVPAVQTWAPSTDRRPYRVGRYRRNPNSSYGQYWYSCPRPRCGRRVEPYIVPALDALDLSDVGIRIGELPRPLGVNTLRRIQAGARMFGRPLAGAVAPPMMVPSGGTWAENPTSATGEPLRTRTANPKGFEALVTPEPFLTIYRRHATAQSVREPMPTFTAGGRHHALVVPEYPAGVSDSAVGGGHAVDLNEFYYRMLKPREGLRAQRFPDSYVVLGKEGEQTMQAGNAVSANVAQWLGSRVAVVLGGEGWC